MIGRGVLVSVRNAVEVVAALAGGAHVIDVKEPARGSLGRAAPEAVAAVAAAVAGTVPWTMAAGELAAGVEPLADWIAAVGSLLPTGAAGPAAVKAGLAGMAGREWREGLERLHAALPAGAAHVAVAYADFDTVAAPAPPDVIAAAAATGCTMLLVDSSDKRGPGLFGLRRRAEIAGWVAEARRHGLGVALAGRISLPEIPAAWSLGPDLVALRSAVCSNEPGRDARLGSVSAARVAAAVAAKRPAKESDQ